MKSNNQDNGNKENKDRLKVLKQRYAQLIAWQRWLVWAAVIAVVVLSAIAAGRTYTAQTEQANQNMEAADVADADDSLFKQAEKLYQEGNYKQAAEMFTSYADSASGHQRFHGLLRAAQAYERAEDFASALQVYVTIIEEHKDDAPDVQYALILGDAAKAAEQTGNLDSAEEYNMSQIKLLEEEIERADEGLKSELQQVLTAAQEYKKHLESVAKFNVSEEARAAEETRLEKARQEAEAEGQRAE